MYMYIYLEVNFFLPPCDLVKSIRCMFISCELAKMGRKFYSGRHGAEVMDVVSLDWLHIRMKYQSGVHSCFNL